LGTRLDSGLEPVLAEALAAVVEACKDGAKCVDLCRIGDDVINK
jgi:methionine aminopeptidase